ncbi:MAG: PhzF family phenazine biosynthesis protein [Solirubrobacteraceae bacterium]
MAAHPYTLLDVFTDTPLAGNPLAVVHEADAIPEADMLRFARETRLSETTFVQTATAAGADYRNRIWDMEEELPFAGHPSLGTAVAVARRRGLASAEFVQQTPAGLQPISVRLDGDGATASMVQEPAQFGPEVAAEAALGVLGLPAEAIHPGLPAQFVSTGAPHLLVPLADAGWLARPDPDWAAIRRLLQPQRALTLYLAWADPAAGIAKARAFSDSAEMGEDPATGSAAGPLGAFLAVRAGCAGLEIAQGVEMGRPSALRVQANPADAAPRPRVSGDAVVVIDGTLRL